MNHYKKVSTPSASIVTHAQTWKTNEVAGDFLANQLLLLDIATTCSPTDLLHFTDLCEIAPDGNFVQEVGVLADKDLKRLLLDTVRSTGYVYQSHRELLEGLQKLNTNKIHYGNVFLLLLNLDKAAKAKCEEFTDKDTLKATAFKKEVHAFMVSFAQKHGKTLEASLVSSTFEKEFDQQKWKNANKSIDFSKIKSFALAVYKEMVQVKIQNANDDESTDA